MLRQEQSQAAVSVIVPKFGDRENDGARGGGLNVKNSRTQGPCAIGRWRAILSVLVRKKNGRGRGNPLISNRRTIAGPRLMRGFSFDPKISDRLAV